MTPTDGKQSLEERLKEIEEWNGPWLKQGSAHSEISFLLTALRAYQSAWKILQETLENINCLSDCKSWWKTEYKCVKCRALTESAALVDALKEESK